MAWSLLNEWKSILGGLLWGGNLNRHLTQTARWYWKNCDNSFDFILPNTSASSENWLCKAYLLCSTFAGISSTKLHSPCESKRSNSRTTWRWFISFRSEIFVFNHRISFIFATMYENTRRIHWTDKSINALKTENVCNALESTDIKFPFH